MSIKTLIISSLSLLLGFAHGAGPVEIKMKENISKTEVNHLSDADRSESNSTTSFITRWEVVSPDTIIIPLVQNETYNFTFEWIEATGNTVSSGTHTSADGDFMTPFDIAGGYELHIEGSFPAMRDYPKEKLLDVLQWGGMEWSNMETMFEDWPGTGFTAMDSPDLSNVTKMRRMFRGATNFNGDVSSWDVSNVSDMSGLFNQSSSFNGDLFDWDVSSVVTMLLMFGGASSFNQDISQWNTSSLVDMTRMFFNASSFNQEIGGWDVSEAFNMEALFNNADAFNQDISGWDVSSVKNMRAMFANTDIFNQDISGWDVSAVTNMFSMFDNTAAFDQDIGRWDVSSVTDMDRIFQDAASFNQSLGDWVFHPDVEFNNTSFRFGPAMDCNSWSSTIIGWAINNPTTNDLSVGGPNTLLYDATAAIFRDELIARGWNVGGTLSTDDCITEKYWLGTEDTDWENADNWGPVGIPVAGDVVHIPLRSNQPILETTTPSLGDLTIHQNADLSVTSSGQLNLE